MHMRKKSKYSWCFTIIFLLFSAPAFAGEPRPPSLFSNTLAVALISLMILLLIIIGVLATILIGAADIKLKERKASKAATPVLTLLLLLVSSSLFAQDGVDAAIAKTDNVTGGLSSSTFYLMMVILFLELLVILGLLVNIKLLIKKERQRAAEASITEEVKEANKNKLSWWDRFNKLRPVSQEAELDLGHEYDGIRELNNRLPPWWLYGFYVSIVVAVIYLWRFHVSHTGMSSKEEYEHSVAVANQRVKEYLKKKGESVDENTVVLLSAGDDISAGKAIFLDPSKCTACHGTDGGGTIGPNLTDDYWIYGGSIKDVFKTIKYGTSKGMRSWKDDLSAKQIAQVASYVKSLMGTKPAHPKDPQGELYKEAPGEKIDSASEKTAGMNKKI